MKAYSIETIMDKFYNLSNKKKVDILDTALSMMHGYNGYSCDHQIAKAMGYYTESNDEGEWFKLTTQSV